MEQSLIYIFFGAILGTFISSISIVAFIFLKKRTIDQSQLEKESVMRSIGELCAEIDSLMLSNRDGILKNSGIQNALKKKHDDIVMLLNKNMHILDAYFVRYIDSLQKDYLNFLTSDTKEADSTSQNSIVFSIDKNAEPSELDAKVQKKSISASQKTGSVEHDLQVFESAFFKESSENAESKPTQETSVEKPKEISEEKSAEKATIETDFDKKKHKESDSSSTKPEQSPAEEEEFTMETIMDLDVGKITKAGMKKTDLFSIKKEPAEEASFEQNLPSSEAESKPEDEPIKSEPPKSPELPIFENDSKSASESPSETPISAPSAKVVESTDSTDITGDDVAEKIDQFFGFSDKK